MLIVAGLTVFTFLLLGTLLYYSIETLRSCGKALIKWIDDRFNELIYRRRMKYTTTRLITETCCSHICGMTFGKQITFEQDFYLNSPSGERRVLDEKRLIAPEINLPKIAPKLALAYLKSFI